MNSGVEDGQGPASPDRVLTWLRRALFAYVLLLLFEGALRKWVLPGLSNPLLLVRDPVLLVIYALALSRGLFPFNPWLLVMGTIGALGVLLSFAFSDLPPFVIGFGFRASFVHLPLIWVAAAAWDREDLHRLGRWFLWLAPGMAVIVYLQFTSPPSSYWNLTPGGGEAMKSVLDKARATGTFSFSSGLVSYVGLLAAFVLGAVFDRRLAGRWLALGGAVSTLAILAFAATRSVLVGVLLVGAAGVVAAVLRPRLLPAMLAAAVVAGLIGLAVRDLDIVASGLEVHATRFAAAAHVEGTPLNRFRDGYLVPFSLLGEAPVIGLGLGLGTNVGAIYLTGAPQFLVSEGEFGRAAFELGGPLGFTYMLLRWGLAVYLGLRCLGALQRGDALPLLLLAIAHHDLMKGQWGIATSLGFGIIGPALVLTALNHPPEEVDDGLEGEDEEADSAPGAEEGPEVNRPGAEAPVGVRGDGA